MLKYLRPFNQYKQLLCLLAFLFITLTTFAQQTKPAYTLLWRISGKDLKQPSYLFGTMHVKDKRVFNFSDSVMLAISKCNSFALEVHPDSMVQKLFEIMQKQDTTYDLHKMLNEKEYARLSKKFEEKNGYKMRFDMNPFLAESMLKGDKNKPGDKESFIDAQLYGIARTMDKTIYGLENPSQQFDKLMGTPDNMKERLLGLLETDGGEDDSEEMIRIYSTGNLNNILNYIKKFNIADSDLVARNHVMVNSIIKDIHNITLFAAVGAAHLPGENGIIALLKQEGYTVTAVPATFTGVAARYHIDYAKMKWVTHTDYDMGYSLDFPSQPFKTNVYNGISTWIFPDLANENFYGIYVIPKGTKDDPASREKIINNILRNFTRNKRDQIISKKNVVVNGLPALDVVVKNAHGYQRSELFVYNNVLYYLYMGNHLKALHTAFANRFFNSFKGFNITEKAVKEWITFKNDTAAFSVKLPLQPSRMNRDIPNPKISEQIFKIRMFISSDTVKLMNYLIRYNDYPAGNFIADKAAMFNSLSKEFGTKTKVVDSPKTIWKDGYEGREMKLIFNGGYHGVLRVFLRGNRMYLLLKQNLHEDKDVDTNDPFFNSFTFEPYLVPTFINFEPAGGNYKFKAAVSPKITLDSTNDYNAYLKKWSFYSATSPASGGVYSLEHATVGKYYRVKNIDSLYKTLTGLLVKYNDTLLKVDTVILNGKKGRELTIENHNSKDKRRSRIFIDEGDVFLMVSRVADGQLFNEESNTFYTSLERTGPSIKADLFSSKATAIIDGLQSKDTTEYNEAIGALEYYKFTADELPVIYSALQKTYPDDTAKGARYKLIGMLKDVHDDKTIDHLQALYKNLQGKDLLKSTVLNTIPNVDPKKGYDIYLNLLTNDKPLQIESNYTTFRPLSDSLQYVADHFQQLIPLISSPIYRKHILQLSNNLLDKKNDSYNKILKDNFNSLSKYAYEDLNEFLTSKDTNKLETNTHSYNYLNLMSEIKGEPVTNGYTNYYLTHYPNGYYVSNAVVARINNRLPVNRVLTLNLLDSLDSRYEIMEAYYKQKQADKIPTKYKNQSEFARLCLYKYVGTDDYGNPQKLKLLGSIVDKGMVYYAFQFNLSELDENATYIGIAGPYKPGATRLNFERYNSYTNYEVKKKSWVKQAKALLPDLKKAYEIK